MTWTPKPKQSETWTTDPQTIRVFDSDVFENAPIFDTYHAGVWHDKTNPSEVWTPV